MDVSACAGGSSGAEGHAAGPPCRGDGRNGFWGGGVGVVLCSQHVRYTHVVLFFAEVKQN